MLGEGTIAIQSLTFTGADRGTVGVSRPLSDPDRVLNGFRDSVTIEPTAPGRETLLAEQAGPVVRGCFVV